MEDEWGTLKQNLFSFDRNILTLWEKLQGFFLIAWFITLLCWFLIDIKLVYI